MGDLDRSNPIVLAPSNKARALATLTDQIGCVDVWRSRHPATKQFSFYSSVHRTSSRIDYFFVDRLLLPSVKLCEYSSTVISDHAPLILDMELLPRSESHQAWSFNTRLLASEAFCTFMAEKIEQFIQHNRSDSTSPSLLWESCKAVIRGEIISYSARERKQWRRRHDELLDAILQFDRRHPLPLSPTLHTARLKLQTEFNLITTNKAEFLLRRTRCTYYEHGDRASRLLAFQLKHQAASRLITQIRASPDTLATTPSEINDAFTSYYTNLYRSEAPPDDTVMNEFLDSVDFPSIGDAAKRALDAPVSVDEVRASLKLMQNGKAPGPDGFPIDFIKKFSDLLVPLLLDMFNDSLERGLLPPSVTQASISLIPKKDKDLADCGSWRPISLLNSDIKLLAKILASCLDPCLPEIISSDQTGFVMGRQLSSNIRRLVNIVLS